VVRLFVDKVQTYRYELSYNSLAEELQPTINFSFRLGLVLVRTDHGSGIIGKVGSNAA
jgi:hypothetical protein